VLRLAKRRSGLTEWAKGLNPFLVELIPAPGQ
jgi:hypothetical protein